MPLSEQEQRLLDEMERHLLHNDADVVSAPSGDRALSYRNLVYGALLLLAGVGGLVVGVILGDVWGVVVGVIGFAAMLAGVMLAVTPVRRSAPAEPRQRSTAKRQDSSSFMDRMNDRWDRRQDGR
ncbi:MULTISPECIES: DUF3040 domain-containing protein [Microbacterium]|uniref:DUF3040 domain-containing protein n=1 Tax=Microbacterium sufflavum TaxID=2851649 RepID=A0ABY4II92_9MICO|nr:MULTISPECIES: DUF3040 domain-containing protein [Microbacterium]MBN6192778.1 DUF3040 domain-containing protein [Aneurinibacillus sp. BA2021]MCK2027576.1 DUF3040 domain-containing protein [Microbacterium sufflavum]UPL12481.1 DUF3040 domain-containing protein [Microbacterium sufflavum]